MKTFVHGAITGVVAGLTACTGVDPDLDEIAFCPVTGCGDNSPLLDGIEIAQASEDPSVANENGVRILGLRKGLVPYTFEVDRDQIRGLVGGVPELTGGDLKGSVIRLHKDGNPGDYFIHIVEAHAVLTFLVGDPDPVWTYRLVWTDDPAVTCTATSCPDVCPLILDQNDEPQVEAIFFEGDLYDRTRRRVIAIHGRASNRWFNVACIGSALAKMHLFRFTSMGSEGRYQSDILQRTTVLKMFGADYCGAGTAFTVVGAAVGWQNAAEWRTDVLPDPISEESVWGPDGARCLDVPRLGADQAWMRQIEEECIRVGHDLPRCRDMAWFPERWKEFGYVRTSNLPP